MAIRAIRHQRVKVKMTDKSALRLNVYRSNKYIFAQLIDDDKQKTVVSFHSKMFSAEKSKLEQAKKVGLSIASKVKELGLSSKIVFDRGGYLYHGRVAKVAEGAREGGLNF